MFSKNIMMNMKIRFMNQDVSTPTRRKVNIEIEMNCAA